MKLAYLQLGPITQNVQTRQGCVYVFIHFAFTLSTLDVQFETLSNNLVLIYWVMVYLTGTLNRVHC